MGPMDVFDAGRMAAVADPEGAMIGLWKAGRHRGAVAVNEPGAWNFSGLHAADPERALAFYAGLFGWEASPPDALAGGERAVNDLVDALGLSQPQVSKHLRVLREVGVVGRRDEGRRRLYRLHGPALRPIHDWVARYESTWAERFAALDDVLAELSEREEGDGDGHER